MGFSSNIYFAYVLVFLGYLESQQMDQIALDFARESPYLREEYRTLKRGVKIKPLDKPRSLLNILKEFIEIEDIGMFVNF